MSKKYRHSKSHAFRVRLTHLDPVKVSHAVRHLNLTPMGLKGVYGKSVISQVLLDPEKSFTYQNLQNFKRDTVSLFSNSSVKLIL